MATCASCGAENPDGHLFCGQCGNRLTVLCPSCGTSSRPGERFCGRCGAPLAENDAPPAPASPAPSTAPVAERRRVSVLFADLVGFTALSESRDPEETRELLSRYFESCRRLLRQVRPTLVRDLGTP
jgi:hypothetical protein